MKDIIRTENLSKYFGKIHAVENVSLNVEKGEIYGFLGLNGAGKTTTIRMLLGMIKPTNGYAEILNEKIDFNRCDLWKNVGHLVETPYSYPELTVFENLEIFRKMRHINDGECVNKVIDKMRLTPYKNRKCGNLSLGNAQRLGLAKALLHEPKILVLDEPSNGLDPVGIVEMRELFKELALNQGVTIFISSHILGEIAKFATRIGIIHEGRLIQEINNEQLENLLMKRLIVDVNNKKSAQIKLVEEGYSVNTTKEGLLEIAGKDAIEHPDKIANILVGSKFPPTLLKIEEENLETYFLRMIRSAE